MSSLFHIRRRRPHAGFALAFLCALVGRAAALPDITPEIFDVAVHNNRAVDPGDVVEGCTTAATGRKLIDFSIRTRSLGPDDLVMGNPLCPDCSTNPNAPCGNPKYVCSAAHGHPHFNSFAKAELLDSTNTVVAVGRKQGFCLLDLECGNPRYNCGDQGITVGCSDVYASGLPCQYIDITDSNLPDGDYTLRVTLDPDGAIPEANENNNVTTAPLHIGAIDPPPITCPVITSTDIPKAIPDFGVGTGSVTSTLTSTIGGTVSRVRLVDLRGTHSYVSDLEFHLIGPAHGVPPLSADVDVLHRVCGDNDDFDLDLSDIGDPTLVCPPGGSQVARPSNALSAFAGGPAAGTWTLKVFDRAAQDTGTLQAWGLEICTTCGNGTLDSGEVCDDGNNADGDCCSSDCQSAAGNGTACADTPDCVVGTCSAGQCVGAMSCDPCLTCSPGDGCVPPTASLCDGALVGKSGVMLKRNAFDADRDLLTWKLQSGSPIALLDFGNPIAVTDMNLCIYDGRGLQYSLTAPAGGTCGVGPCWKQTALGYRYVDKQLTPDGIGRMILQSGDPYRAKTYARGKGANLGLGDLTLQSPVTVRLKRSGGPACWEAQYDAAVRSSAGLFKAKLP